MRAFSLAAVLFSVVVLASCASAPAKHTASEDACADPMYIRLKAIHPDSLSEREFTRLRDLEAACHTQQSTMNQHRGSGSMMRGSRGWLLMPAMMVIAGGMALMMGWWR